MITARAITARYKQPWMQQHETYATEMSHNDADETLTFELPNGSVVELSYLEMRTLIASIEKRRLAD